MDQQTQPDKQVEGGTGFFMPRTAMRPQKSLSFHHSSRPITQRYRNGSFNVRSQHAKCGSPGDHTVASSDIDGQSVICEGASRVADSTQVKLKDGDQAWTSSERPLTTWGSSGHVNHSGSGEMHHRAVSKAGNCHVAIPVLPARTPQLLQETFSAWQPCTSMKQEPTMAMTINARAALSTASCTPNSWCMDWQAEATPGLSSGSRVTAEHLSTGPVFRSPLDDLQQLGHLQLHQGALRPPHAPASTVLRAATAPCHQLSVESISSVGRLHQSHSTFAVTPSSFAGYSCSTQAMETCGLHSSGGYGTCSSLTVPDCMYNFGLQAVLSQDNDFAADMAVRSAPEVMQLSQCEGGAGAPIAAAALQHKRTDADELLHIEKELQSLLCLQQQLQVTRKSAIQLSDAFDSHVPVLGSYSSYSSEVSCLTPLTAHNAVLAPTPADDASFHGHPLRLQAQQKLQQLLLIQQMERELQQDLLSMLPKPP